MKKRQRINKHCLTSLYIIFCLVILFQLMLPQTASGADFETEESVQEEADEGMYNAVISGIRKDVISHFQNIGLGLCAVSIAWNGFYFWHSSDEIRLKARNRIFYSMTALIALLVLPKLISIFSSGFGLVPWSPQ